MGIEDFKLDKEGLDRKLASLALPPFGGKMDFLAGRAITETGEKTRGVMERKTSNIFEIDNDEPKEQILRIFDRIKDLKAVKDGIIIDLNHMQDCANDALIFLLHRILPTCITNAIPLMIVCAKGSPAAEALKNVELPKKIIVVPDIQSAEAHLRSLADKSKT